jgi:hypothetical protein
VIRLGDRVTDKVSGFGGIVTGIVDYVSGCRQALVGPQLDKDGKLPSSEWFDIQRLEVTQPGALVLDNALTPGCDAPPPKR